MCDKSEGFTRFIENTKTILECLAILAAGIWAVFYFNIVEIGETKANFNGGVTLKLNKWHEKMSACIYDFEVAIENVGKQTQKIDHIKYTVCELAPPKNETIGKTEARELSGECVATPTEVKMNPDFIMGQTGEVQPGEKKMTVYTFVAPIRDWPWQVEATGYADKDEKHILFKGSDWQFCSKPKK